MMTSNLLFRLVLLGWLSCSGVGFAQQVWVTETIAGTSTSGHSGAGGPALDAEIDNPFGVIRGPDNAIWFCEYGGQRVRRIDPSGIIQTIVGSGKTGYSGDGGPAIRATLNQPHEIRFDRANDLYIVDMQNHAIRKVEMRTLTITTIAGDGKPGYTGDGGAATSARLNKPHSLQFDRDGNLFVCDIGNHVIRKIDAKTGTISTFAGTGKPGPTRDAAPIAGNPLNGPRSIDFDRDGNLWLATREGNQIFKMDLLTERIEHVAGTGKKGFQTESVSAKHADLSGPKGIAVDPAGNVWIADTESHSVRMIDASTKEMRVIAGTGNPGDGPDGDAAACRMKRPHGVFVDHDGSVLVGDSENHRLRVIRPALSAR